MFVVRTTINGITSQEKRECKGRKPEDSKVLHEMDWVPSKIRSIPSCDLKHRIKVKIGGLNGKFKKQNSENILEEPLLQKSSSNYYAELRAEIELYCDGKLIALPVNTSYKPFSTRWNGDNLQCRWDEWIVLPLRLNDLPKQVSLCVTIYDCLGSTEMMPLGGTTISLFGKNGVFRQGFMELRVWPEQVADGGQTSATPGKLPKNSRLYQFHKLSKKHRNCQMPKVDWLDRISFGEIEHICEKDRRESNFMYLDIEFPVAEYAGVQYVVPYYEKYIEDLDPEEAERCTSNELTWLPEPEMLLDNLVENKHHVLLRCPRAGLLDVDLKPNASVRDHLNAIVNYPPTQTLSANEQDLIWTYRYYLSSNEKALAKLLKCVKWDIDGEKKETLELIAKWAPMDAEDALELLGPQFTQTEVRLYAVAMLKRASDDDLMLYLLQLVQALKYEDHDQIREALNQSKRISTLRDRELGDLPDAISATTKVIGHAEGKESKGSLVTKPVYPAQLKTITTETREGNQEQRNIVEDGVIFSTEEISEEAFLNTTDPDLASFLIYRACENSTLLNYFFWYLWVECEDHHVEVKRDKQIQDMYINVRQRLCHCLEYGKLEWKHRRTILSRQQQFIKKLAKVLNQVAAERHDRPKKIEMLQNLLAVKCLLKMNSVEFDALPFPLDPEVLITGVVAKEATLYKSSKMPCKLTFNTVIGDPYITIFKYGDDLRQDQLVLQLIALMDKLLRKENLDLKLTPYRVIAFSTIHGFVQFVPSRPVAEVLKTDGSIHNFFKKLHYSEKDAYNIESSIMDTYVKSCAGYCVVTYLLGIGDRHLDNLMLTKCGKLFHIDFGYILGRDPHPMPPPMKLSKEMVDAMGGTASKQYQEFKQLCYTAFLHLRRNANLILNLFSLMVGASVPDIAVEPDKAVKKVLEKFRLELNDEAAVKYMQELIDVSFSAYMPAIRDICHRIAQSVKP